MGPKLSPAAFQRQGLQYMSSRGSPFRGLQGLREKKKMCTRGLRTKTSSGNPGCSWLLLGSASSFWVLLAPSGFCWRSGSSWFPLKGARRSQEEPFYRVTILGKKTKKTKQIFSIVFFGGQGHPGRARGTQGKAREGVPRAPWGPPGFPLGPPGPPWVPLASKNKD